MDKPTTAGPRENELARLIFSATDLSSVQRLHRYLSRHPHLWLTLSDALRTAIEKQVWETHQVEYLVNGSIRFSHHRPDCFSLYSF